MPSLNDTGSAAGSHSSAQADTTAAWYHKQYSFQDCKSQWQSLKSGTAISDTLFDIPAGMVKLHAGCLCSSAEPFLPDRGLVSHALETAYAHALSHNYQTMNACIPSVLNLCTHLSPAFDCLCPLLV